MSNQRQTVDDVLVCLLQLGFEYEDCQAALQHGKLTVEEATDWIVSEKTRTPELRLGSIVSAREPQAASFLQLSSNVNVALSESNSDVNSSNIVSRLHLNDEKRKAREHMEDKMREEAKRKAVEEKMAKKQAIDSVRRQIEEDRALKREKLSKQAVAAVPTSASSTASNASTSSCVLSTGLSLLQIRMPDGRVMRQSFGEQATFNEVCNFVAEALNFSVESCRLIQPFPRREFSNSDLQCSLKELGLVPNGSLAVVVHKEPQQQSMLQLSGPAVDVDVDISDPSDNIAPAAANSTSWNSNQSTSAEDIVHEGEMPDNAVSSGWNSVNDSSSVQQSTSVTTQQVAREGGERRAVNVAAQSRLVTPGVGASSSNAHGEEDDSNRSLVSPADSDNQPASPSLQPPPPPPLAPPAHAPLFPVGGGGMIGYPQQPPHHGHHDYHHHMQHNWGLGMPLSFDAYDESLAHHRHDPRARAAEAAGQRRVAEMQQENNRGEDAGVAGDSNPRLPTVVVRPLLHLTVRLVSRIVSDPVAASGHVISLQGLPANLAELILDQLKADGLLRNKTLQQFVVCRLSRLSLANYSYTTNELLASLRNHVYLAQLDLTACTLINDKGLQPLTHLHYLRSLNLNACRQLTNQCLPFISELRNLTTLLLSHTAVTSQGIIDFCAASPPPALASLDLSNTQVTHAILPALQALPELRVLNLEGTQVASLLGINSLQRLEALNVRLCHISTDSLLHVVTLPALTMLNISDVPAVEGDLALRIICDMKLKFLQLPNRLTTTDAGMACIKGMLLTTLDLTNYHLVSDVGIQSVGHIASLRHLRLSNTRITDVGLSYLTGLQQLDELVLDRTAVTDEGVRLLTAFPALSELSLAKTGITDASCAVLSHCKALSKLNLSNNEITNGGVLQLRLPHLILLNACFTLVAIDTETLGQIKINCPSLKNVSSSPRS